jgi:hypothetical protein
VAKIFTSSKLKIYLAGVGNWLWEPINFYDFYRLDSYLAIRENEDITRYKDFILDSGIFTYLKGTKQGNIDWDKYVEQYAALVKKKEIRNYVEVDVDSIIGLDETERLRRKLEKIVGWKSMPVWHMNRGYDKWLEICRDYDYICFGAFLTDSLSTKKYRMIKTFLSDANKSKTKVHGLGFTNFSWMSKLHFYSVDSSSWLSGVRYGHVCIYENGIIRNIQKPSASFKIKDIKELAKHNFKQWVLFTKYAEMHL